MLITQQLSTVATQNLAKPALRYLGKEMTYNELKTSVARLSYLYQRDIGHGARVAFITRNAPAVITTFFALSNIRALTIPIHPDRSPDEIIAWLKESKATHVAVTSDLSGNIKELLRSSGLSLPVIEIEKKQGGEFDTSFTAPPDHVPVDTDTILLLRTAGNTGKPKLISFTHKQVHQAAIALRGLYRSTPADRILTTLNWAHPFAFLHSMLFPVMTGATCVIDHGLEGVEFLDFILDSRVTRLVGTPRFYVKLLNICKNEKRALPGTKSVTVGMGFLHPALKKVFGMLKIAVLETYGQTENLWTIAMQDFASASESGGEEKPMEIGFSGRGLPGTKYKVIDENGDEIPGKEERIGQLAITGPSVMSGYLDREKETKSALRGTWLYTGDYASLVGDGEDLRITFLGRKDEILIHEGKIIPLHQIEAALKSLPGVQDVGAFVARDSTKKLVVGCVIVKAQASVLTEKQIVDHCSTRVPSAAIPKSVSFTDSIPRDEAGTIQSAKLRAQFAVG